MKKRKGNIFFQILALLTMAAIFYFSSQSGGESSGLSLKVTRFFSRILFFNFKTMTSEQQNIIVSGLHPFIRKLAHFSVYAVLGMCVYSFIVASGFKFSAKGLIAWICCILYAIGDEIHQNFVPARAMQFTDVLIDSAGALLGIFVASVLVVLFMYISGSLVPKDSHDQQHT